MDTGKGTKQGKFVKRDHFWPIHGPQGSGLFKTRATEGPLF